MLEQTPCEDGGGAWLGGLVPPVLDCSGDPCLTGACCHPIPEGLQCNEDDAHDTLGECLAASGTYHGGLECGDDPCQVCPFEDADHCQLDTGDFMFRSDRALGIRIADDFRAPSGGGTINRVCYWHGYVPPQGGECSDNPPDDGLSIRFYEDAFGLPGTELANSPGENAAWDARGHRAGYRFWRYSAPIEPGIQVESEECYWIEITGLGDPDCSVHCVESRDGNDYSLQDFDGQWGFEDFLDGDLTFCLDIGITPAVDPGTDGGCGDLPLACCRRDNTCDDTTLSDCYSQLFFLHQDCADISCTPPNDDCADATVTCEEMTVDPDAGYCDNDDGIEPGTVCSVSAQDCYDGSACVPWDNDAYRCQVPTDNVYATTGGPPDGGECTGSEGFHIQSDIWYRITAPCTGDLVIDMCSGLAPDSGWYHSKLAIFSDHTSNPSCPVDSNADLLDCSEWFCPGPDISYLSGVQTPVSIGGDYLIRVGGFYSSFESKPWGRAELDIGFLCYPPPVPPALPTEVTHQAPKNRYVTIDATSNDAYNVAYEVTLASMKRCSGDDRRACIVDGDCPGVCDNDNNLQCTDDGICGGGTCLPTDPCIEHSDVGSVVKYVDTPYVNSCIPLADCATQWFAQLTDSPVYRVWSENAVHILGCQIVPVADYDVRATADGVSFSDPLTIGTIPKPHVHYADCVGPVVGGSYTAPDGFTNVTDVQAFLAAQGGAAIAPHTTWVDLQSGSLPVVPQQILNVGDLQTIKAGFTGSTYVNTPGHENPGDCP